jgi:hypothetical protein
VIEHAWPLDTPHPDNLAHRQLHLIELGGRRARRKRRHEFLGSTMRPFVLDTVRRLVLVAFGFQDCVVASGMESPNSPGRFTPHRHHGLRNPARYQQVQRTSTGSCSGLS